MNPITNNTQPLLNQELTNKDFIKNLDRLVNSLEFQKQMMIAYLDANKNNIIKDGRLISDAEFYALRKKAMEDDSMYLSEEKEENFSNITRLILEKKTDIVFQEILQMSVKFEALPKNLPNLTKEIERFKEELKEPTFSEKAMFITDCLQQLVEEEIQSFSKYQYRTTEIASDCKNLKQNFISDAVLEHFIPVVSVESYKKLPSERDTDSITSYLKRLNCSKAEMMLAEKHLNDKYFSSSPQERRLVLAAAYYHKDMEKLKEIIKTTLLEFMVFKDILMFCTKRELESKTKKVASEQEIKTIVEEFEKYKTTDKKQIIEILKKFLNCDHSSLYANYLENKDAFLEAYYNFDAALKEEISKDIKIYGKNNPEIQVKNQNIDVMLLEDASAHFATVEFKSVHNREPQEKELEDLLKTIAAKKWLNKKDLMKALRAYFKESKESLVQQYLDKQAEVLAHLYEQSPDCIQKIRSEVQALSA